LPQDHPGKQHTAAEGVEIWFATRFFPDEPTSWAGNATGILQYQGEVIEIIEVQKPDVREDDDYDELTPRALSRKEKRSLDRGVLQSLRNLAPKVAVWALFIGIAVSATFTKAEAAQVYPEAGHILEASVHGSETAHDPTMPAILDFSEWDFDDKENYRRVHRLMNTYQPILTILKDNPRADIVTDLAMQQYRSGRGYVLYSEMRTEQTYLPGVYRASSLQDHLESNVMSIHKAIDRRLQNTSGNLMEFMTGFWHHLREATSAQGASNGYHANVILTGSKDSLPPTEQTEAFDGGRHAAEAAVKWILAESEAERTIGAWELALLNQNLTDDHVPEPSRPRP
jgi:hypothetical protein